MIVQQWLTLSHIFSSNAFCLIRISAFCSVILFGLILSSTAPLPVLAQSTSLSQEQERMIEQRKLLYKLTQQERKLYKEMAGIEDRIDSLERELLRHEDELAGIQRKKRTLGKEQDTIKKEQGKTKKTIQSLMTMLWPIHLSGAQGHLQNVDSWDEADRMFAWLKEIYLLMESSVQKLEQQSEALETNITAQNQLEQTKLAQLKRIESTKRDLLQDRLQFLKQVQEIRALKLASEEQINTIVKTIEQIKYEMQSMADRSFKRFKGRLPWPTQGKVAKNYRPRARPPMRGLGISVDEGSDVRAISWGKVVHNDQLRGFGQVIILSHGDGYYSLYAFLSKSNVFLGQNIERGEPIGTAGYYPDIKKPGVYFELRFRQKAVNPLQWLASR